MMRKSAIPLFVCHANCCRSVMAKYLYEHFFPGEVALSAGIEVGEVINDRACAMLRCWDIDASQHQPRRISPEMLAQADAIFLMGPEYLCRLLQRHGADVAAKAYLFANPFVMPQSLGDGEYLVFDPSFENRPIPELAAEFSWFRERVAEIHAALSDDFRALVPASRYLNLLIE